MPPKKEEPKPGLSMFEQVLILLFVIYALSVIWARIQDFLIYYKGATFSSIGAALASWFSHSFMPVFEVLGAIVSVLCVWGIARAYANLSAMSKEEKELYGAGSASAAENAPEASLKNERWERVLTHINSANSSDWRLAIIEADVMLDELLKSQGYHGDSLGERLRGVEKSDFTTIDNAWEAHRVRNQIAHAGADFPLSDREAKRAISLYESVFREFRII